MSDFEGVLEECLDQLSSGASSVDEFLARYPEHAARLKPLLRTAGRLERAPAIKPSPAFKSLSRARLTSHMRAHPHQSTKRISIFWRVAVSLAVLVFAFLFTGTALAQNSLPSQSLYVWKLSSERVWRALAPDRVAVDLGIADRRIIEMTASAADPAQKAQALNGYLEVLARLKGESNTQSSARILQALKYHQTELSMHSISIPELDNTLSPAGSNPPAIPAVSPGPMPGKIPHGIPTVQVPPLPVLP